MKQYEINKKLGFVKLPFEIKGNMDDQLKELRKDKIVQNIFAGEQQTINDFETTAFGYVNPEVSFNLLFHHFGLTGESQPDINRFSCKYRDYQHYTHLYFNEINIEHYPMFWNSLQFPFYDKNEDWYNEDGNLLPNRFEPKAYEYNSFLKMNFYTTTSTSTQELLFENVVFVNPRWCEEEGDEYGKWTRPTFSLDEHTDGYFFYWLNDFDYNENEYIDTFYVNFQFWNATNNRLITFIPTSETTSSKNWVQSANFDYRNLYLECKVNYNNKTYSFREFDENVGKWVGSTNQWNLTELVFNESFSDLNPEVYIENINTCEPIVITPITTFDLSYDTREIVFEREKSILAYDLGSTWFPDVDSSGNAVFWVSGTTPTFWHVREKLKDFVNIPDGTVQDTITITNNSNTSVYLKDMEIIFNEAPIVNGTSTYKDRTWVSFKKYDLVTNKTTYTISTIPYSNESPQYLNLDKTFATNYDINKSNGFTTATFNDIIKINPYSGSSDANTGWWFPPDTGVFNSRLSELLYIEFDGRDTDPIHGNESITLTVKFRFTPVTTVDEYMVNNNYNVENTGLYSYAFLEPRFYGIFDGTDTINNFLGWDENVILNEMHFEYTLKTYFNNQEGSLPFEDNIVQNKVRFDGIIKYSGLWSQWN